MFPDNPNFSSKDRDSLIARAIDPDLASKAGIRRVTDSEGEQILGRRPHRDRPCSGLLIPYYADRGCTEVVAERIRLDIPMELGGKKSVRYLQKQGTPVRAYYPYPFVPVDALADTSCTLIVVEGEFKAVSLQLLANLTNEKLLVVGIPGVNCWSIRGGQITDETGNAVDVKTLITDLRVINFNQRKVYVLFDADSRDNLNVRRAADQLAQTLKFNNARVAILDMPSEQETGAKGIDDLIHLKGDEYVREWLTRAMAQAFNEDDWGAPLPFSEYELPTFPTECFPDWTRQMVESLAIATQTPVCASGLLALSVLSAAVAGKYKIQVKDGWREPLNVYCLTLLPSANRKTAVVGALTAPIVEYEKQLIESQRVKNAQNRADYKTKEERVAVLQKIAAKATSEERLNAEDAVRDAAAELAAAVWPADPQLICDDVTPEQLATLLVEQCGRIALFSDEGTILEIMGGRYSSGSSNLEVFLKSHIGSPLKINRRGRAEYVESPTLTMGLAAQNDVLAGLASKPEFRGRGMLGRFFYCVPKSLIGARDIDAPCIPPSIISTYAAKVDKLLRLDTGYKEPLTLTLSPSAFQEITRFARFIEKELREGGELGEITDWGGKLVGGVARIAGLLHLAEHAGQFIPMEVAETTARNAVKIGKFLIPHARAAYALLGTSQAVENARFLLRWIKREFPRRNPKEQFLYKKSEIYRAGRGRFKTPDDADPAINLLVSCEYFRPVEKTAEPKKTGRKPSAEFRLNPLFINPLSLDLMDTMDTIAPQGGNSSISSIKSNDSRFDFQSLLNGEEEGEEGEI